MNRTIQKRTKPTPEQFEAYQRIYDYLNETLFEGQLPGCILNFSRKANTEGFFSPDRWEKGEDKTHEISINPAILALKKAIEVAATLLHEMAHLWQREFGKPGRGGYHNKEWADKMEVLGLMPSHTGQPGGNRTGDQMSDYIIEGGRFEKSFDVMPVDYLLPWRALESIQGRRRNNGGTEGRNGTGSNKNKIKYSCSGCGINVWGKPGLNISCLDCDTIMTERGEGHAGRQ